MTNPPGQRPGPSPAYPPEYPYGSSTPGGAESLLFEPGTAPPVPGRQPWGPGHPPGYVPVTSESAAVRARATAALIVSVLLLMPCFNVAVIPAIVTSSVALAQSRSNLPLARILLRVTWIWIAVSVVLEVAFFGYAVSQPSSTSPSPTPFMSPG